MTKPDDSSLSSEEYEAVRRAAIGLLNKGDGWDRLPTPVSDLMTAANLRVAPMSAFNVRALEQYARQAGEAATRLVKSAIDKVLGIFDVQADVVHIDEAAVKKEKQNFLKLHETGHKEIPHQRGLFKWIQDCSKTLAPEIADLFDREANNFATIVLFQDDRFATMTADSAFGIKVPLSVGRKFGASAYAAIREYVRRHQKACAVIVLEKPEPCHVHGMTAVIRRIDRSPEFARRFGELKLPDRIIAGSPLASFIPGPGKRMSSPGHLPLSDLNNDRHEFIGEGFSTPFNVFILIHANATLGKVSILMPSMSCPEGTLSPPGQ